MKKAWYILNYHNISWEENSLMRPVGGTFSPDLFEEHIAALQKHFEIVGVNEGYEAWKNGKIQKPMLSIWFDDGFAGCRLYGEPILRHFGYMAAMSINSSFTLKKEIYWRLQLAWLYANGYLNKLRKSLSTSGYQIPEGVVLREFTLGEFDIQLRNMIHEIFAENAGPAVVQAAQSLYDSVEGLCSLKESGWVLANHTASHFPVSEKKSLPLFISEFEKCEQELKSMIGVGSEFWVLPFDRKPDPGLHNLFESSGYANTHTLVHVGNKINHSGADSKYLYRLFVPDVRGNELVHYLKRF